MIETRHLKTVVIFIQVILSFVLSRKIISIYDDIARKYDEKLKHKMKKIKLNIDFLNNCKHLGKYRKLLIFELKSVSDKDAVSIRRRLLRRSINKCNKELQHL